ncbi:MAG: DNA-binding transcriptional regulator OxyR [Psychromonas sp.]|nr:DNA-binding transcriptional regulator OxyR [Alteromonadales bacterium]MCP5076538.1 DNA-binding transcriptional regulator OxyR [Psychromonas sp.]
MNLRDLEYLVAVNDLRHFRKAAERCFVSQPTLSGQVRKLEDELGITLIERNNRKVIFTNAGEAITEQARRVLMEVSGVKDLARSFSEPMSGPIHVGLIPTVAPYLLPRIVKPIQQQFSDLEMFFVEDQTERLLKKLNDGELDCVILALLPRMDNYGQFKLYKEPLELVIPEKHDWNDRKIVHFNELKGKKILMLEDGHCLRDQAMEYCFVAGAEEDNSFRATSLETLRFMVGAGTGITLLPQLALPKARKKDGLIYLKIDQPLPQRQIVMLFRSQSERKGCFEKLSEQITKSIDAELASYDI